VPIGNWSDSTGVYSEVDQLFVQLGRPDNHIGTNMHIFLIEYVCICWVVGMASDSIPVLFAHIQNL
jgi:hypothetical protein